MKLWQKIFLLSLIFVTAASGITALAVLHRYFALSVEREEQSAAALHSYLAMGIEGSVVLQKLDASLPFLSDEETETLVVRQLQNQSVFDFASVLRADGTWLTDMAGGIPQDMIDALWETDGCLTYIADSGSETFLTVGSVLHLEGNEYILLTVTDISAAYRLYREQSARGLWLSAVFALVISVALLLCCRLLLRPLGRINGMLGRMTYGEYDRRLPEKGGAEFVSLSRNVNALADAVEQQTAVLQEVADSRKRFVDNMAHEMKTPLTSILCMADLLRIKRSVTDKERMEYAGVIVEETKRMQALSKKLLTLATADGSAPDFRETSLAELLSDIENAMQPVLERRSIRLTVAGDDVRVWVDRQLFQTMLVNLIDNAAKASADGQRVVVYHTVREKQLLLAVVDEGIGMTQAELRRATEAFWMADKSRSRKAGGAGLGLALCKEIAELHGARMTLESERGKGTTVTLQMPLAKERDRA